MHVYTFVFTPLVVVYADTMCHAHTDYNSDVAIFHEFQIAIIDTMYFILVCMLLYICIILCIECSS